MLRFFPLAALLLLVPAAAVAQESELIAPPMGMAQPVQSAPLGPSGTELQVRIGALETQLRNVTGQLERTQYQNQQLQQTLQRMNADNDGRFQLLEHRVGGVEARQAATPVALPAPAAAVAPAPAAPAPAAPAATPAPATTSDAADAPETANESTKDKKESAAAPSGNGKPADAQALYDQAFQAMRQAKYDEAEAKFKEFLKANPKHRLTENAKYWLGETYYVRSKFQEAAVAFGEGFQQFPKGPKAPDNLLKLSMSLGSLDKKQDACTTLAELKKRFPAASAIIRNRAEQEKKTLACT